MKRSALASLALAFATAFALADGYLGTPTLVGDLSSTTNYVYQAAQVDTLVGARVPTNRTVNGHGCFAGNPCAPACSVTRTVSCAGMAGQTVRQRYKSSRSSSA